MTITIRFQWDGELTTFASVNVDHASLIPNVGDTLWLREATDDLPKDKPAPVVEITVLERRQHLFVDRRRAKNHPIDRYGNVIGKLEPSYPTLEMMVFVARVNKDPR